ncbi:hypothetical protein [Liberiplasma polymorphum]|uniref:helix-turn-helix domain-containing protein n=1 Tax=Liberiplasma polymorphum TaxID=3374570 RepID=UPI003775F6A8
MTNSIYPKSNLKILGQVFKFERMKKGYSLRGIARSENVAPTLVSEIETGKIFPNVETLERLFSHVDINLITDLDFLTDKYEQLELYNEAMYYGDRVRMNDIFKLLYQKHHELFYSLIYIDYMFSYITYQSSYNGNYSLEEIDKLEVFYDYFSEQQKQRFNLIKGVNLFKTNQVAEAVRYLEANQFLHGNQKAYAINLSYLAFSYERQFRIHNCILQASRASRLHGEHANLRRKLAADLVLVKNLTEVGRFDEAVSTLNNLELSIQHDDMDTKHFFNHLRFLRSYTYYRQKKYEQALKELDLYEISDLYFHFYKANILNRLNRNDEAVSVLKASLQLSEIKSHYLFSRLNKLFMYFITKKYDNDEFETLYIELSNKPEAIYEFNIYRIIQIMALEYYEHNKLFDKALKVAKDYMKESKFL